MVRRLEAVERAVWVDGDRHLSDAGRAVLGRRLVRWGGTLAIVSANDASVLFNRAIGVGLEAPADDALLDAIHATFAAHPHPHAIQLAPTAEPADLAARLRARGYAHHVSWIKWMRDVSPPAPAPTALRLTRATVADLASLRVIYADGLDMTPERAGAQGGSLGKPGWSHWLAWDGDTPVAMAGMFVDGDAAWFGAAITRPAHRGRGGQSALLAARIAAAREAGCRLLTLETGPDSPEKPNPSYRNVARAGFTIAYERPSWVWPHPAPPRA